MSRASEKAVPEKLGRQTPTAAVVLLGMFPGVLDPLMEGIVGPMFQG